MTNYDLVNDKGNTAYIVFYNQYGKWSLTAPFKTLKEAKNHSDMYLRGRPENSHNQMVTIREIKLPTQKEYEASE